MTGLPELSAGAGRTGNDGRRFGAFSMLELAFVFLLPVFCLIADVAIGGIVSAAAPAGFAVALLIGMIAYGAGKRQQAMAMHGFLAGLMDLGFLLSTLVFLVLLPLSLVALMFGIGVLGFVPLGTAYFYGQRIRVMYAERDPSSAWHRYAALGVAVGVLVPLAAQLADYGVIARASRQLDSTDPAVRLQGLATLTRYPLCLLSRCEGAVCSRYVVPTMRNDNAWATAKSTPEETMAIVKLLGPNFQDKCERILD
jgi:hypothetical protein